MPSGIRSSQPGVDFFLEAIRMKIHPVAELFPMLSSSELQDMAASIKRDGLLNPCVRMGDTLLDGRNRLAACKLAGVEPTFTEYTGSSPVAFIIGANLARRHLDKGQKVALALEIEPHFADEAKKRQEAAGEHGKEGGRGNTKACGKSPTRVLPSRDQAAAAVGVTVLLGVLATGPRHRTEAPRRMCGRRGAFC